MDYNFVSSCYAVVSNYQEYTDESARNLVVWARAASLLHYAHVWIWADRCKIMKGKPVC